MALAVVVLLIALVIVLVAMPYLRQPAVPIRMQSAPGRTTAHAVATAIAPTAQVQADFSSLRRAIDQYRATQGRVPADDSELQQAWRDAFATLPFPTDPYNGQPYAYRTSDGEYSLTSAGPNLRFSSAGQ
jgi:Type II secretion system (T2SS), protein G